MPGIGSTVACAAQVGSRYRGEHPGEDLLDVDVAGEGLVAEEQPVAEDLRRHVEHVLGCEVAAAPHHGQRPPGPDQADRSPGAGTQLDVGPKLGQAEVLRGASAQHEVDRVLHDAALHEDLFRGLLQPCYLLEGDHLGGAGRVGAHSLNDLHFLGGTGIVDHDLHEEPVALSLRQRVHALGLDGVLGR